jgi:hypothetical protein
VVADLFLENQAENVDLSGLGDYRQFVNGLSVYGMAETDLHAVHQGNTADLPLDWSTQLGFAPFRLVSVDAGHTANATRLDLTLVFCNLLQGGIVVLDDWFHPSWPGVVEGYYRFALQATGSAASPPSASQPAPPPRSSAVRPVHLDAYPFLICESKLYLTNSREHHMRYYDLLLSDPDLGPLVNPYSFQHKRGNVLYEMDGVNYLRCPSRQDMAESDLQQVWSRRVY